ncbi:MAG: HAD-IA family hydrolase [Burkholderiaceae bacterium]
MNATRPRIDLVSFDLDGTLVDTATEIAEAVNRTLEAHAVARRRPDEIALLIGAGAQALMRRLYARCVADDAALAQRVPLQALLDGMDHHYAAVTGLLARPYPDCLDALARLRAAGVHVACVTNKEARHAHRVLQATGLADAFGLVVGGDTLAQAKPDARVLQHVARHFGTPLDRTAHVGDSSIDVQAARNAGVHAWAVPYGYNAGVPVAQAGPDRLFDSLAAVAEHVLALRGD